MYFRCFFVQLLFYSRRLIKRVEMPDMPDVDVQKLVTRYIVQLNLPLALVAFVRRLFEDKLRFSRLGFVQTFFQSFPSSGYKNND